MKVTLFIIHSLLTFSLFGLAFPPKKMDAKVKQYVSFENRQLIFQHITDQIYQNEYLYSDKRKYEITLGLEALYNLADSEKNINFEDYVRRRQYIGNQRSKNFRSYIHLRNKLIYFKKIGKRMEEHDAYYTNTRKYHLALALSSLYTKVQTLENEEAMRVYYCNNDNDVALVESGETYKDLMWFTSRSRCQKEIWHIKRRETNLEAVESYKDKFLDMFR